STIAFFPLFPLVIRWVSTLTGLSYLASGIAVASLSGLTAMVGVWYLVRSFADRAATDRSVLLLAFFPGSFVLNMVYAEGMMVTLIAFGLWALLARRWVLAGLLGALASATSPVALAFELSCLWCAYRALADERDWRSIAAPVLAPLGFVAFQTWLWVHTGDLWAWRVTERYGWQSTISPAFGLHSVLTLARHPISGTKTEDILFVGIVVTVVGAVVAIRRRMPMPVLLYGLAVAVLAFVSSPVGLRPRFLFDAFPLVIGVGLALRRWRYVPVLLASALSLVALTAFELASYQVFP
ncbi:MAG: glycosyltransferase 87 family protein, partial [Acidimicrobiales bacterium]